MSNFIWFLVGNISGAIVMTAIWVLIGSGIDKKSNKDDKGDK